MDLNFESQVSNYHNIKWLEHISHFSIAGYFLKADLSLIDTDWDGYLRYSGWGDYLRYSGKAFNKNVDLTISDFKEIQEWINAHEAENIKHFKAIEKWEAQHEISNNERFAIIEKRLDELESVRIHIGDKPPEKTTMTWFYVNKDDPYGKKQVFSYDELRKKWLSDSVLIMIDLACPIKKDMIFPVSSSFRVPFDGTITKIKVNAYLGNKSKLPLNNDEVGGGNFASWAIIKFFKSQYKFNCIKDGETHLTKDCGCAKVQFAYGVGYDETIDIDVDDNEIVGDFSVLDYDRRDGECTFYVTIYLKMRPVPVIPPIRPDENKVGIGRFEMVQCFDVKPQKPSILTAEELAEINKAIANKKKETDLKNQRILR